VLKLHLPPDKQGGLSILCLGAHSDDLEIGCGGTLMRLVEEFEATHVTWVVFSGTAERTAEARASVDPLLEHARTIDVVTLELPDGFFPDVWGEAKAAVEDLKGVAPDIIFTHFAEDGHQDHRVISQLTWSTFRDHLILEYEIPKWDGDLGRPSVYVPLSQSYADRKVEHLMEFFPSQHQKDWYDEELFRGLLRLRGVECRAEDGFAEAFHGRKVALAI
jgi:LmbE family N-acetylglucosaminyl deacetylase